MAPRRTLAIAVVGVLGFLAGPVVAMALAMMGLASTTLVGVLLTLPVLTALFLATVRRLTASPIAALVGFGIAVLGLIGEFIPIGVTGPKPPAIGRAPSTTPRVFVPSVATTAPPGWTPPPIVERVASPRP